MAGFKTGVAFHLAASQLPKLFGFKGTQGDFWERSAYFIGHVRDTHGPSLLLGATALAVLIAGKLWMKNRPVAFLVVVAGIFGASTASRKILFVQALPGAIALALVLLSTQR